MDYRLTTPQSDCVEIYRNITRCEVQDGVLVLEDDKGLVTWFNQNSWNCIDRLNDPQTVRNLDADLMWCVSTLQGIMDETQGSELLQYGVGQAYGLIYKFRERIDKVMKVLDCK